MGSLGYFPQILCWDIVFVSHSRNYGRHLEANFQIADTWDNWGRNLTREDHKKNPNIKIVKNDP